MAFTFSTRRPVASVPSPLSPKVAGSGGGFTLNTIPSFPTSIGPGLRVSGLPSPSIGSVLPQSRTVPVPVLSGLPHATPSVGASFGATAGPPSLAPRPHSPTANFIGVRH